MRRQTDEEIREEIERMERNWKVILEWTGAELRPDGSYHKRHPYGLTSLRLAADIAEADAERKAERERDEQ